MEVLKEESSPMNVVEDFMGPGSTSLKRESEDGCGKNK